MQTSDCMQLTSQLILVYNQEWPESRDSRGFKKAIAKLSYNIQPEEKQEITYLSMHCICGGYVTGFRFHAVGCRIAFAKGTAACRINI